MINTVIQGDCLEVMKTFEDECVDLTVTSPPYDNLRTYNGYTFNFEEIAKELFRITKRCKQTMKILSLFDGISCARVALERAGIPVEAYYASEIDKYAQAVSRKNWLDILQTGSVTRLKYVKEQGISVQDDGEHITFGGDIDLLIGGSPCQDLSIAKKNREGLKGNRSSLFYEYVRILNEVKPKYFILENVASMPKEAKQTITDELFGIEPVMINAALVSAQNRKRLFWVGKLDKSGIYRQVDIKLPEDRGILLKDILEENVDEKFVTNMDFTNRFDYTIHETPFAKKGQALRATDYKGTHNMVRVGQIGKGGQGDRIYSTEGKSVNLSANGGGRGAKTGLYAVPVALRNRGEGKKPEYNNTGKANSLTTVQTDSMVDVETVIRKLTPIECERLQGLPDNYTEGISNTQRYKCLGNAFNVDVVAHILSFINLSQ